MAQLWTECYRPSKEVELVVQKKKVAEVKEFFTSASKQILLLKGPPGCGKATVIKCLCNDLGLEAVEWSPAWKAEVSRSNGDQVYREPLSAAFLRFLAQTDRYHGLNAGGLGTSVRRRVALVRDFPLTLLESRGGSGYAEDFLDRFRSLANSGSMQRCVFCFNDSREEYRAISRLFDQVDPTVVARVDFDAIARTFAQRALDNVARSLGVQPAAVGTADLATECGGDLRNAVNALQYKIGGNPLPKAPAGGSRRRGAAARGRAPATPGNAAVKVDEVATQGLESATQAAASEADAGNGSLRQTSLGLFHSLGRLLYNKRVPPDDLPTPSVSSAAPAPKRRKRGADLEVTTEARKPQQLPHEMLIPKSRRPPLYFVPEEVLHSSASEPSTVVEWLFTNAPRFYGDVEDLADFAETLASVDAWDPNRYGYDLGFSEAFNPPWDTLGAEVQVRGLLDANLHPVPPTFGDPGGSSADGPAFNMVKPLLRDMEKHKLRRQEMLSASLTAIGPQAFGGTSVGLGLLTRVFPFVHLILYFSRGHHASLRQLPSKSMQTVMELCTFHGRFGRLEENSSTDVSGILNDAAWVNSDRNMGGIAATALADDPIESFA